MARGDRFFLYPTRTVYDRPEEHGLAYEEVSFNANGAAGPGQLHGWLFRAAGDARGTVVHCHGNAGNITGHYRFVAWLPRRGWNVFCFDYAGFGRSAGHPSRERALLDTHAAIDCLSGRDDIDPARIVLFGQSLGGTVATAVAAERDDLAGLAAEGAFSSYRREARFVCRRTWWLWGVSAVVPHIFIAQGCDPIDCVGRIGPIPKLFICGTADGIVDYRQTVDLHALARDPKDLWVIEGGAHTAALVSVEDDLPDQVADRRERFCDFLDGAVNGFSQ